MIPILPHWLIPHVDHRDAIAFFVESRKAKNNKTQNLRQKKGFFDRLHLFFYFSRLLLPARRDAAAVQKSRGSELGSKQSQSASQRSKNFQSQSKKQQTAADGNDGTEPNANRSKTSCALCICVGTGSCRFGSGENSYWPSSVSAECALSFSLPCCASEKAWGENEWFTMFENLTHHPRASDASYPGCYLMITKAIFARFSQKCLFILGIPISG